MVEIELSAAEQDAWVERIAHWAADLGIGSLVAFLLECNRPVAPLTANLCIAAAPLAKAILPFSLHGFGLLMMDENVVPRIRKRVTELESRGRLVEKGASPP